MWIGLTRLRILPIGCCVYGNEPSGTKKCGEFVERVSEYHRLKEGCAVCESVRLFITLPVALPSILRSRPLPQLHSLLSARLPQSASDKATNTQVSATFHRILGV